MISLVVFLGNYGREYAKTRHNVAWLFEESLSFSNSFNWQKKFKGNYCALDNFAIANIAQKVFAGQDFVVNPEKISPKVYFLKPETYMNLSGESIIELAQFFKIKPEEILVIHDELELSFCTVSLKWAGGLGGHNGLRSTKAVLGTADFWRIRIGIGRPNHSDISSYVLSAFSQDEQILLAQTFMSLEKLLVKVLVSNPNNLLKEWSKKKLDV